MTAVAIRSGEYALCAEANLSQLVVDCSLERLAD